MLGEKVGGALGDLREMPIDELREWLNDYGDMKKAIRKISQAKAASSL